LLLTLLFRFWNNIVIICTTLKRGLPPYVYCDVHPASKRWKMIWATETCCSAQYRGKHSVGVTVNVIGIFSFFCVPISYSAAMAPSVNDMRIHGLLVSHVVSALLARNALFGIRAGWNQTLLKAWAEKGNFLRDDFKEFYFV
jgi:hypothetical protein